MITGVFLKNLKIYKKTRLVPVSPGHKLAAFVGPNGAGKSSVLEALNTYFNDAPWIVNKVARQAGETTNFINYPYVCPIFAIPKSQFRRAHKARKSAVDISLVETISEYFWSVSESQISNAPEKAAFIAHRDAIAKRVDRDSHFLLVSGTRHAPKPEYAPCYFGPFHQQQSFIKAIGLSPSQSKDQLKRSKENDEAIRTLVGALNDILVHAYDFIYVPSDVSIADYTKLQTAAMQLLMGRDINSEIRKAIPDATLKQINDSLERTVAAAVDGLPSYTYDKPKGGKKNITLPSLSRLITKEFFSIRELSMVDETKTVTPISHMSSGEQRRALIDVTSNYLLSKASLHVQTIFAIDEPEISLHTTRCYDQFERLFDVARAGIQTIITTHWYGFLPIAQDGSVHFLSSGAGGIVDVDSYDLSNYREKATKRVADSKGQLPFDISLKSANDLVQSIASSLRHDETPYSWILCEGTSEMVYFSHMFAEEIASRKLRVLPLGGASEVLRIYRHLEAALADKTFRSSGKVLAIIDTDEQLVSHRLNGGPPMLQFKRLLLPDDGILQLVNVDSNLVSPATEIEDCLNPHHFVAVFESYKESIDIGGYAVDDEAQVSGRAFDLKSSQRASLKVFFDEPGRKVDFARKYVERASDDPSSEPLKDLIKKALSP